MPVERPKILVVRGGAIGDFILTLPVLAALRAQFPAARLTVLGYPHIARLALAGALADEVQPIESRALASFFNPRSTPPPELAEFFAGFALVISYLFDPDEFFRESVRRCTRAQYFPGPHRPDEAAGRHATEVFLKPLESLAIFDADPVPRLALKCGEVRTPGRRLAIHPGSGSENKNWPESNWARLLERLAASTDLDFLLVGGEAEGHRLQRLAQLLPHGRLRLAQSLPLPELAGELSRCIAFAGHDSGITHLAAAVGVPVLALWGESNETVWRPRGESVRILRGQRGLESLAVERVHAELGDFLAGLKCP
jgi:heptosyltransferase-2